MVKRSSFRTCIACRKSEEKRNLLRFALDERGEEKKGDPAVVPDPDFRLPGRGAYLHASPDCLAKLGREYKLWSRAFRRKVHFSSES